MFAKELAQEEKVVRALVENPRFEAAIAARLASSWQMTVKVFRDTKRAQKCALLFAVDGACLFHVVLLVFVVLVCMFHMYITLYVYIYTYISICVYMICVYIYIYIYRAGPSRHPPTLCTECIR